eukprot:scaffold22335_cov71-Phaeocystis_antarctica.AAC.7
MAKMRRSLQLALLLLVVTCVTALRPLPPVRRRGPTLLPRSPARRRLANVQQCSEDGPGVEDGPGGVSGAAVSFLRWYKRTISPLIPPGCRYIPTCSEYAIQSFKQFDVPQATTLTAWRLVRCNPLHLKGYGYGVDAPCWPPPAYWAGSGRVRNPLDDEASRRKAMGVDDPGRPDPFSADGLLSQAAEKRAAAAAADPPPGSEEKDAGPDVS